jgi:hypothetical protein
LLLRIHQPKFIMLLSSAPYSSDSRNHHELPGPTPGT